MMIQNCTTFTKQSTRPTAETTRDLCQRFGVHYSDYRTRKQVQNGFYLCAHGHVQRFIGYYGVKSQTGKHLTHIVRQGTHGGWECSCPDYLSMRYGFNEPTTRPLYHCKHIFSCWIDRLIQPVYFRSRYDYIRPTQRNEFSNPDEAFRQSWIEERNNGGY